MDTIGLLSAWLGVMSLLAAMLIMALMQLLTPRLERSGVSSSGDPAVQMVRLYGSAILTAIGAATVVVVSIEMMDLAPGLLAATLPFPIDGKTLTRVTGLMALVLLYYLLGRLCYLAVRIRQVLSRKA